MPVGPKSSAKIIQSVMSPLQLGDVNLLSSSRILTKWPNSSYRVEETRQHTLSHQLKSPFLSLLAAITEMATNR